MRAIFRQAALMALKAHKDYIAGFDVDKPK
jgi:hypothetical protein